MSGTFLVLSGTLLLLLYAAAANNLKKINKEVEKYEESYLPLPPSGLQLERRATTVFFDDFSSGHIDPAKWSHAITADGGGNEEFNMYTPEAVNSYVKGGILYIRPTYTVDTFGADFLTSGTLDVKAKWGTCTNNARNGCLKHGTNQIPPIMSASISTKTSIQYGRVEVVAELPIGDWLWPAIWMLPTNYKYGGWPRSGEIDIMEARGNLNYHSPEGWTMGAQADYITIHYGVSWESNLQRSHGGVYTLQGGSNLGSGFHTYWMDWTKDYLKIGIDDHTVVTLNTPAGGYWQEGRFTGTNIWANGGHDAPFDQPFHLILNVAVGGHWFNSRNKNSPYLQPWADGAADKMMQFWDKRNLWQPTWHGEAVAMKVKSVKMIQY